MLVKQIERESCPKLLMFGEESLAPQGDEEGTMQIALASFLPSLHHLHVSSFWHTWPHLCVLDNSTPTEFTVVVGRSHS